MRRLSLLVLRVWEHNQSTAPIPTPSVRNHNLKLSILDTTDFDGLWSTPGTFCNADLLEEQILETFWLK